MRKSQMALNEVYFWTNTIVDWKHLLAEDDFKEMIIDSFRHLVKNKKIVIYSFVIMPNHIHVIWEMLELNGKEMPYASFQKFTAHKFLNKLKDTKQIVKFKVHNDIERKHRFWQRDPLAIKIFTKWVAEQKLDYIHLNPLQAHWNLSTRPEDYRWSSAKFYEEGIDEFGFLTDYRERF